MGQACQVWASSLMCRRRRLRTKSMGHASGCLRSSRQRGKRMQPKGKHSSVSGNSRWAPCKGMWPVATEFRATFKLPDGNGTSIGCDPVSRSDVCGWRWRINERECMDATLEHLAFLLYPKFVHYAFTIAAVQTVRGRLRGDGNGMTLADSHVLLKFSWLVLTVFGPCLPILHALIALLANIYSVLLFGTDTQFLYEKETRATPAHLTGLPSFGFGMVVLLAFAWQSSNLL
eukprot:1299301-Amphidinium_carterae.1